MSEKVGPALRARLESLQADELLDVDIFLNQKSASETLNVNDLTSDAFEAPDDTDSRIAAIKDASATSQSGLLSFLEGIESDFAFLNDGVSVRRGRVTQTFWISNSVAAEITPEVLKDILARDDVLHVELRADIKLEDMLDGSTGGGSDETLPFDASDSARIVIAASAVPTPALKRINAPLLWKEGLTGEGIIVAVVDSGVNYDHPDLKSRMWDGGLDFPHHGIDFADSSDNDPRDNEPAHRGHGTFCAGIVAGDGTAGTITGVAPRATIMAIRVGEPRTIWKGLQFALDHGAHVISMSLSEECAGPLGIKPEPDHVRWRTTCETLLKAGKLHANSIGNNGQANVTLPVPVNIGPPGNCPPPRLHPSQTLRGGISSAISCGATDDSDSLYGQSGKGPVAWDSLPFSDYPFTLDGPQGLTKPDLCAPGVGTMSCNSLFSGATNIDPYRLDTGTSFATAHVSGCLALLAQACKRSGSPIVPAFIQEALETTAVRIAGQTQEKENHYGAGRVDVYEAYKYGTCKGWWK